MAAATYDFEIEQGTTVLKPFVWKDSAGAINLTGYTARMQVRASVAAPDVLLSATTENNKIVITSATGTVSLSLSDVETAAITWKSGKYDLELVSGAGFVTRLVQGSIKVLPEVTRA